MAIPDLTWPQVVMGVACLALLAFVLHLAVQAGHDPYDALNHPYVLSALGSLFGAAGIGMWRNR